MAALDKRTMEVMACFQRFVKSGEQNEITAFKLEELRQTDVRLGNRDVDAGFRIALQNRIKELESVGEKKYQSVVRTVGYVVAFALGVLSTLAVKWLGY